MSSVPRRTDSGMAAGDESPPMPPCAEEGCEEAAAVRLHVPWADDREVCTAHARAMAQQDGVVAEPLSGAEDEWP